MTLTQDQPVDAPAAAPARTSPAAPRLSRRRFLRRALLAAGLPLGIGVYSTHIEPYWLESHEFEVQIPNLPASFDGYRIVHLTDMHAGENVDMRYLGRVIDRLKAMNPDCVAVTGDLINHTDRTIEPVAELLGTIDADVFVSFGNHDYCPGTARPQAWTVLADPLEHALRKHGCTVLRNRHATVSRGPGERLTFVGLEDLYTTRFFPNLAFRGVDPSDTTIALSHNPETCAWLQTRGAKLVLSGHTHGGQVRLPLLGAPILPLLNRRYEQGLFKLKNDCQMYVSRGVGFLWKVRLFCRPELPCIVLRRAEPSPAVSA